MTREQIIRECDERFVRTGDTEPRDYSREVAHVERCFDLVRGCKALPALADWRSYASCDVDHACDRHERAVEIGTRLLRMRASRARRAS